MAEAEQAGAFNLDNTGIAFGLVVGAGLSTALGAAAVFFKSIVKLASKPILAVGLGFSAGVMLYVSFVEIFVKSNDAFASDDRKENDAYFCATICLFAGMALLRLVHFLVHKIDPNIDHIEVVGEGADTLTENEGARDPEVPEAVAPPAGAAEPSAANTQAAVVKQEAAKAAKLQKMGVNTAIAIAIHNFPEGLATFVATLVDPSVGATLAIAIGVHNIPEGLCVALPIYYATNSRMKGFLFALLSGISEPIGAFIGWLIIKSTGDDMSQLVYGILFGLVAGMMIMICVLELLPTAYSFDPADKYVTHSVMAGMAVMAASLCLFQV